MSVTGILLSATNIMGRPAHFLPFLGLRGPLDAPPPGAPQAVAPEPLAGNLSQQVHTVYAAALRVAPLKAIAWIELRQLQGVPQGVVTLVGEPEQLLFNALTGEQLPVPKTFGSVDMGVLPDGSGLAVFHQLLKRFHRGDIIGTFYGRYLDIAAGVCLAYLVGSALVLYFQMLNVRRKRGNLRLFWR